MSHDATWPKTLASIGCWFGLCLASTWAVAAEPSTSRNVVPVAHRGLLHDAPENTLANFAACLELQIGFEFDVRRSRDGVLICIHDETLDRTTNGTGAVATRSLTELRELDAGSWFAPAFHGAKIPTIDEIFRLIAAHPHSQGLYTVDLKADDPHVEADTIDLAKRHGVLDRLVFIGRAIEHLEVRTRLRAASATCHVAVLAQHRAALPAAIDAVQANWVYVRFVPTTEDIAAIRAAGKQTIIAGPVVVGLETQSWTSAATAGVDAVLTDYPLELRRLLKKRGQHADLSR